MIYGYIISPFGIFRFYDYTYSIWIFHDIACIYEWISCCQYLPAYLLSLPGLFLLLCDSEARPLSGLQEVLGSIVTSIGWAASPRGWSMLFERIDVRDENRLNRWIHADLLLCWLCFRCENIVYQRINIGCVGCRMIRKRVNKVFVTLRMMRKVMDLPLQIL